MNSGEDMITRGTTALGSLLGYYLAKSRKLESWYPLVVLGGLTGAALGELLIELARDNQNSKRSRE